MKKPKEIRVGDTWEKPSKYSICVEAYTPGFIIYNVGLSDYRVIPEHVFRRDFIFSYADPKRKLTYFERFKIKYNSFIEKLFI